MQDREGEIAPWPQRAADRGDGCVKVVDVREAEVTGHGVEVTVAEKVRRGYVFVDVADAQRLVLLGRCRLADQDA
jgi:hypothetical protein